MLLLHLLDPLPSCASSTFIDDIPLNTIDRSTLRQRIMAVPQDTVFFPDDTFFRVNLDPFATATDQECQAVLEIVNLWALACDRRGLVAGMVSDTLSQGQKQLFSLARAIVRRRVRERELGEVVGGVLILDEISSSVDVQTNRAMQEIHGDVRSGTGHVMLGRLWKRAYRAIWWRGKGAGSGIYGW